MEITYSDQYQTLLANYNPNAKVSYKLASELKLRLQDIINPQKVDKDKVSNIEITPELIKIGKQIEQDLANSIQDAKVTLMTLFYSTTKEIIEELEMSEGELLWQKLKDDNLAIVSFLALQSR